MRNFKLLTIRVDDPEKWHRSTDPFKEFPLEWVNYKFGEVTTRSDEASIFNSHEALMEACKAFVKKYEHSFIYAIGPKGGVYRPHDLKCRKISQLTKFAREW